MTPTRSLPLLVLLLALPAAAQVQEESPLRKSLHARSFGMGGAFRGAMLGADVLHGNPAGLAAYKRYLVELGGFTDLDQNLRSLDLILTDSTGPLAGGYSYQLLNYGKGGAERTAHLNTLGLAVPVGPAVAVGAAGRHILMTEGDDANALTLDVGALVAVGPARLSLAGHNLVDISNPEATRYYSLGVGLSLGMFTVGADLRADWERNPTGDAALAFSVGGEAFLGNAFPLRLGFERDTLTGKRSLAAGLGLYQEGSGIDLGYRHDLGETSGQLLSLTIRVQAG